MKTELTLACVSIFAVVSLSYAADDTILPEEYIPDLSADADMSVAEKPSTAMTAAYGGWVTPMMVYDNRGDVSTSSLMTLVKLWGRLSLGGNSFIYVRGKDIYAKVLSSKDYNGDDSNNIADLDAGYIELATNRRAVSLSLGRKFFLVGSGVVIAGRGDGADLKLKSAFADLELFGLYTGFLNKDDNPYARSDKDNADGAKRVYAGAVVEKQFFNQTAYLFGVMQNDRASENANAKIRYQSQYYGAGIKGVPADGLDYFLEGIYERGKSYLYNSSVKKSIAAYAVNASVIYYFEARMNPSVNVQYAFASGDNDRYSATDSSANTAGNDTGFIGFGSFNGGLAFRPDLSNLHVMRIGGGFMPFISGESPRLKRFNVGIKYSYYMKDKSKGGVNSEGTATEDSRSVGQGVDLSVKWKVFSDLSFFAQYGLFIPGQAFSDKKKWNTAMFGLLLEF